MNTVCHATNPAVCRYHGLPGSSTDLQNQSFNIDFKQVSSKNQKESDFYTFFLTDEEKETIAGYCNQDYTEINKALYSEEEISEETAHKINVLDQTFARVPRETEPRHVYRAGKPYTDGKIAEFSSPEEAETFFSNKYPVGKEIEFHGFTSTTEDPNCLVDFTTPGYDSHPPRSIMTKGMTRDEYNDIMGQSGLNNIIFEMKTADGIPVSQFGHTHALKEQEVLLPRNKKFRVKAIHANKMMTFINRRAYDEVAEPRLVTIIQLEEV